MPKELFASGWWLFSSTIFCLCSLFALKPVRSWQCPVLLSLLDSSLSASTSSREWNPTVQLPQALKIALNFPSLCMCSLEPQPCWMSQLLQDDIAAEIRHGLCKEKSKDPLVALWETSKGSRDESVTHFLSPCWLLTTLGNSQGCVGIKSSLAMKGGEHNSFECKPWSQNSS